LHLKLFSTSTIHGSGYLDYCEDAVKELFAGKGTVLFIPYARPGGVSHDEYTAVARKKFNALGFELNGIHEYDSPAAAVSKAEGVFIGGGNTFVLLNALYANQLVTPLKEVVAQGTPYMGTSAGTNMAGLTIGTTNDMPIVYPPSFNALGLIGMNINPHYLDPDPSSTHKGETRATRIKEFHTQNKQAVVGLREGSWLTVSDEQIVLEGELNARIFEMGKEAVEVSPGTDLNFLST
jgi:dipeptidase E